MRVWVIALTLLVGVALGASGMVLAPRLIGPYLPESVRGKTEPVEGEVARKQREQDRLLLMVVTGQGAILATFTKRVTEIDLLVEQGDTVTLALRRYEPFVEDPAIERVRKPTPASPGEDSGPAPAPPGGAAPKEKAAE